MSTGRGWRAYAADAALALVVVAFLLIGTLPVPFGGADVDPIGHSLLLFGALAVVVRRRAPVAVLLVTAACVLGYYLRAGWDPMAAFPVLVGIYTAVRGGRRVLTAAVCAGFILSVAVINVATGGGVVAAGGGVTAVALEGRLLAIGWLVASAVMGEVSRQRESYLQQVEARAADAERTREEAALRRAAHERLRIARELHDSLTHSISIIKVQAGVAVHLARKRGEPVPDPLLAIQEASNEAVRELRSTLEVLRHTDDADGIEDVDDDTASSCGLARLADLVERARGAGLPAGVRISGTERALPPDIDRAAYRIVQEALTNVTRHAGPASASIEIGYCRNELTVRVDDDGQATRQTATVPGVGLIGMGERVSALGGRLHAEPRPEGGFTVRAGLPLQEVP